MSVVLKDDKLRKRAPNFSVTEKMLLLNVINNFKNIVENKQTNAATWREKDSTWTKIAADFNSQNQESHHRTKEALKKYYENIKKSVRKEVAEEKKEINKTGGGSFVIKNDTVKELALNLMNKKTVFGLDNNFDGDSSIEGVEEPLEPFSFPDMDLSTQYGPIEEHSYAENKNQVEKMGQDLAENFVLQGSSGCSSVNVAGHGVPSNSIDTPRGRKREFLLNSEVKQVPVKAFSGHVSNTKTLCLKNKWTTRRKPTPQLQSDLNKEYSEAAKIKRRCFEEELINIQARREHEQILFELKKENLLLEIELKKQELNKFHNQ